MPKSDKKPEPIESVKPTAVEYGYPLQAVIPVSKTVFSVNFNTTKNGKEDESLTHVLAQFEILPGLSFRWSSIAGPWAFPEQPEDITKSQYLDAYLAFMDKLAELTPALLGLSPLALRPDQLILAVIQNTTDPALVEQIGKWEKDWVTLDPLPKKSK